MRRLYTFQVLFRALFDKTGPPATGNLAIAVTRARMPKMDRAEPSTILRLGY